MKNLLIVITSIILMTTACAANTVEASSSRINPGKFYGMEVHGNVNIILSQGEGNYLQYTGSSEDAEKVQATVKNGILVINGNDGSPVNLRVNAEEINFIELNGSGRVYVSGSLYSDILLLKLNGSGSIRLDVRSLSVGMMVKGSGKIIISGSTGESHLKVFGNATVSMEQLYTVNHSEVRYSYRDIADANETTDQRKIN